MRYAVLADIHGNLQALDAVLAETRRQGVDGYLVAGDLVGYGADPNACVERVAALDAVCVAGNHDLIALGRLSADRCIPLAQASLRWTAAVLSAQSRRFLAALPPRASAPDGIVVAHGSLSDPQEYVHSRQQALAQLRQLHEDHADARALALGHTHIPLAAAASRRLRPVGSLDLRDTGTVLPIQVRSASRASCGDGRASCCSTPNNVAPASWRSRTTSTAAGTRWSARDSRSDPATCVRRRCAPACAGAPAHPAEMTAGCGRRGPLPAIVGEGLVRLRHAEDVVLALERAALL